MQAKELNKNHANIWQNLPNITTLLQYLDRQDLIQLSKCCKRYRYTFESEVLKELDLYSWKNNNKQFYNELRDGDKIEKVLEVLKADLGSKLKFVDKFGLNCDVNCSFAEIFVKLLPNIKTLNLSEAGYHNCCLGRGLSTILKGVKHLEHLFFCDIIDDTIDHYSSNKKVFPKSIKSIEIEFSPYFYRQHYNPEFLIYDTIDTSYINLKFLTIISNKVLQNLSSGLPNLKKANHQIKTLSTEFVYYNEEIIKTLLSSKHLEYWSSTEYECYETEANNFPENYSIKHLQFYGDDLPALLTFQIINALKASKL